MRKIPTLFERSEDRRHVIDSVTPGCEWVLAGEGLATRKYDGIGVLIRRDGLAVHGFARRIVAYDVQPPAGWFEVDRDDDTRKRVGWEPIANSGFARWLDEAVAADRWLPYTPVPGTYELIGPKINGNPEGVDFHMLIQHGYAAAMDGEVLDGVPRSFAPLGAWLAERRWEGIVWHHPDGRMAKIKRRDFPEVAR